MEFGSGDKTSILGENIIMKNTTALSTILAVLIFAFSSMSTHAQLVVSDTLSANEIADLLIGDGVNIFNVSLNCPQGAHGAFNATNSNIGMDEGVMLSSGSLTNAIGPNNSGSISQDYFSPGDSTLTVLAGQITFDACVLEFDITPERDTLKFEYVFGSDEYLEFVNMGFNDVFAFHISGPGITGIQNIALIPGTSIPVAIDNVHSTLNSQFYVDNGDGSTAPQNTDPAVVQYDGFTTVLTATVPLTPGQTYHLRLAICDAGDGVYDSGVFIAQISSTGCPVVTNLTTNHITPNSARLSWNPVGVADHYVIRGWPVGSTNYNFLNIPPGAPNFKNVAGLSNNTCYAWQIVTYCDPAGNEISNWSAIDTFCTACQMPGNISTNPVISNGAQLNWDPSPGSAAYEIKGKRIGSTQWTTILVGGTQTSLQAFGLIPATSYHWTIRAWCDTGAVRVSSWTPLTTFTTTTSARMAKPEDGRFINFEEADEGWVRLYPNPVESDRWLFVDAEESFKHYSVFNLVGDKIRTGNLLDEGNRISIGNLVPGIYLLEFETIDGTTQTERVLVQ